MRTKPLHREGLVTKLISRLSPRVDDHPTCLQTQLREKVVKTDEKLDGQGVEHGFVGMVVSSKLK